MSSKTDLANKMESDKEHPATPRPVASSEETPVPTEAVTGTGAATNTGTSSTYGPEEEPKALSETKPIWEVILVVLGILMSLFLVALDRTILSTAIPEITNEYNSFGDYAWYGSAYLLSCCAVQLLFGKVFTMFSVKYTLFLSVLVFEIASAICGAAPSSISFIIGRAIAGLGSAGIFAGAVS